MLSTFLILSGIMIQGGITAAIFKFYNDYSEKRSKDAVIGTVLAFVTVAALAFCLLSAAFASSISYVFLNDRRYGYFVILMLGSFFLSIVATVPKLI